MFQHFMNLHTHASDATRIYSIIRKQHCVVFVSAMIYYKFQITGGGGVILIYIFFS